MRIIINEDDQKTKFYKMATIFAQEYNKYVPEDEKAHIVLPHAFLLSKVKHLFPDSLTGVQNGDHEKKFIQLVNEKRDLFHFEFTAEDRELYNKLYSAANSLLGKYKAMERASPPRPAQSDAESDGPASASPGPLSNGALTSLRSTARYNDELLTLLGTKKDTWFSDRGIGDDAALQPHPSDHAIPAPALFLALLQSGEARRAMGMEANGTLPAISESTLPKYREIYAKACALMEKVNQHAKSRASSGHVQRVEAMNAGRRERPPVSKSQMRNAAEDAQKLERFLTAITPQRMEELGIASRENILEYDAPAEGKNPEIKARGVSLFQAMLHNSSIRNLLVSDGEIKRASQQGMFALVKKDMKLDGREIKVGDATRYAEEPTIFAVEDLKFWEENIKNKEIPKIDAVGRPYKPAPAKTQDTVPPHAADMIEIGDKSAVHSKKLYVQARDGHWYHDQAMNTQPGDFITPQQLPRVNDEELAAILDEASTKKPSAHELDEAWAHYQRSIAIQDASASAQPLFERPRRRERQSVSEQLEEGFPLLDVPKPGLLYATLKTRLSALKIGHPEREDSINQAMEAMHQEIQRSGHALTGHSSSSRILPERIAEEAPPLDAGAHTTAAAAIRAILDGGKAGLRKGDPPPRQSRPAG